MTTGNSSSGCFSRIDGDGQTTGELRYLEEGRAVGANTDIIPIRLGSCCQTVGFIIVVGAVDSCIGLAQQYRRNVVSSGTNVPALEHEL